MAPSKVVYASGNLPAVEWEVYGIGGLTEWTVSSTLPQCKGWLLASDSTWADPNEVVEVARQEARRKSDDAISKGFIPEETDNERMVK